VPTHFRAMNEPLFSSKANQWVWNLFRLDMIINDVSGLPSDNRRGEVVLESLQRIHMKIHHGKYEGRTYVDVAAFDPDFANAMISAYSGTGIDVTWSQALVFIEVTGYEPIVALCEPPHELGVRFCDICLKSGENREPWRFRIVCRECRGSR